MTPLTTRAQRLLLPLNLLGLVGSLAACGSTAAPHVAAPASLAHTLALPDHLLPIQGSLASDANDPWHRSEQAWDGNLGTWWSANGVGQWARFDLGRSQSVSSVSLGWYRGDLRQATFDVDLSEDGVHWTNVLSRAVSSGQHQDAENYPFTPQSARYVRVTNEGNTENTAIGLTEIAVYGGSGGALATGRRYFVDCSSGDDSNDGTAENSAWRSLRRANAAELTSGDGLFLRRGCTFQGPLNARWSGTEGSPVVIDGYGSGPSPVVRNGYPGAVTVSGRYQVIQNLQVSADAPRPYAHAVRCGQTPNGWTIGFSFTEGARHNTLAYSEASGFTAGVHLQEGATDNHILHDNLHDNNVMSQNEPDGQDDNSGAWGIVVNGEHNEIGYNTFSHNSACSEDYGVDGAAIELYSASHTYVHHNTSVDDTTFSELGGTPSRPSSDNTYAENLYAPIHTGGEFFVLRGWRSKWGGNPGTKLYNNTAYLVTVGISCSEGCDRGILSAHNNIVWLRDDATKAALWADGPFDEGNNIYWKSGGQPLPVIQGGAISSSSRVADPRFVNPDGLDFHLRASSPAVGAGVAWPLQSLGIGQDLLGNPLDLSGPVNVGAVQPTE